MGVSKDTGTLLLLLLLRLFLGGLHPQTHHDTKYSASAHTFHSIRPVSSFSSRYSPAAFRFKLFLNKRVCDDDDHFVYYMANPLKKKKRDFSIISRIVVAVYTYVLLSFRWSVFFFLPCREIREEEEAEGGQQHLPSLGDFRLFYGRDLPR